MNIAQLPEDAVVLDPMCGSGTTLVEASLSERTSFGLDMNPLSVFISDVKCRALTLAPGELAAAYAQLKKELAAAPVRRKRTQATLRPDGDRAYLERWFAPQTLLELDSIDNRHTSPVQRNAARFLPSLPQQYSPRRFFAEER